MRYIIILYLVLLGNLWSGELTLENARVQYSQGKFQILKLPSGEIFLMKQIFNLPRKKQKQAWEKMIQKALGGAKKEIRKVSKEIKNVKKGKKSDYIRSDKEIKAYLKRGYTSKKRKCNQGDANSCFYLGYAQYNTKSKYYLMRACSLGESAGCYHAGFRYSKNLDEKLKLFKRACQRGYSIACTDLGSMYLHGREVKKDYKQAIYYLTIACNRKFGDGCILLAAAHRYGLGVTKDLKKGKKYLNKAYQFLKNNR